VEEGHGAFPSLIILYYETATKGVEILIFKEQTWPIGISLTTGLGTLSLSVLILGSIGVWARGFPTAIIGLLLMIFFSPTISLLTFAALTRLNISSMHEYDHEPLVNACLEICREYRCMKTNEDLFKKLILMAGKARGLPIYREAAQCVIEGLNGCKS
jgi:hypothetical protein